MKLYDFDFIECYDEEANYDFDEDQKKPIGDLGAHVPSIFDIL